jgi:type I restriction enzyme, S subunit
MKPEIRFKGFEEEWEKNTIGNIADVVGGGTPSTSVDEYWNGDIQWFTPTEVGKNKYVKKSVRTISDKGLKKSGAKLLPKGTLLLSSRATIGEVSIAETECCTNQGFQSLIAKDVDRDFLYSIILTMKEEMKRIASGSTFLEISANKLRAIPLYIPSKNEQQEVGSYFGYIDQQISSASSRLTSLRQLKEASLQAMFPQEGENVPRIRFKGFEGEWKKIQLCDCLTISNEKNLDNSFGIDDVLSVSDEVGVVNQIELLGRSYAGKSVANYGVLKTNQIVYTKSPLKSKPYGIIKVNKGKTGIVSVLYAIYDTVEGISPDYIHYYFDPSYRINNYLLPLVNKGAKNTMNISDEMALQGYITIPTLEEQSSIASYFRSLDRQISLQSQRLEKLKQIKAACLDKMFV